MPRHERLRKVDKHLMSTLRPDAPLGGGGGGGEEEVGKLMTAFVQSTQHRQQQGAATRRIVSHVSKDQRSPG